MFLLHSAKQCFSISDLFIDLSLSSGYCPETDTHEREITYSKTQDPVKNLRKSRYLFFMKVERTHRASSTFVNIINDIYLNHTEPLHVDSISGSW